MAIDLRPVIHIIGLVLMAFGAVMLFPAALDLAGGLPTWVVFVTAGIAALFVGGSMALATANEPLRGLGARQAFVLTVGIWVSLSVFGALPFMLGPPGLSFTDAVFEAVSGITTTGSTVIVGLDDLPPGISVAGHAQLDRRSGHRLCGDDLLAGDAGRRHAVLQDRGL